MRKLGFALLIAASAIAQGVAQGPPADAMVDVGGYRLNVRQGGSAKPGVPTVVFENGFGTPLQSWTRVQQSVSEFARTISYDRAGVGGSEVSKDPPTPANIARQLHTLLARLEAPPPYILVGHSYGGPLSYTFAATYPKEVAGLVYVDPTDFTQTAADSQELFDKAGAPTGREWMINMNESGLQSARPGVQAEFREIAKAQRSGYAAVFRERGDAPDVPIVVLLAGQKFTLPPGQLFPGDVEKFWNAAFAQRMEHFGHMTSRAKNGMLLVVGPAGHFVHATEPDTVVWAIRRVLDLTSAK